mgnify:CR=1 FL=1
MHESDSNKEELIEKVKDVQKMLEVTKMEQRKQSIPKDNRPVNRYGNLSKRIATKNESVQKVEVFLASQEINDTARGNYLYQGVLIFHLAGSS